MSFDKNLWDLFQNFQTTESAATQKAKELCVSYLGPSWNGDEFRISRLSGGMNNLVFKCQIQEKVVLLRIQCQKDVMQLQNELVVYMELANHGLGPKMLGIFPGGRLEEFLPSRTPTYDETKSLRFTKHVAMTMTRIHQVEVPVSKSSQIISFMRQWLRKIEDKGGKEWELWSKNAKVPRDKFPANITIADLASEVFAVEKYLETLHSKVYLTHNDLFAYNMLLKDGFEIGEDGTVWKQGTNGMEKTEEMPLVLIDFEFGMYNYRGFDIGNHLNELANTYFDEMPTYTIDLEKLNDKELHRTYCEAYLKETYKLVGKKELGEHGLSGDLERDVEGLLKEVDAFIAISNLWWGIWNIICAQEGWLGMDFESGFRDRLCLYYYKKTF